MSKGSIVLAELVSGTVAVYVAMDNVLCHYAYYENGIYSTPLSLAFSPLYLYLIYLLPQVSISLSLFSADLCNSSRILAITSLFPAYLLVIILVVHI